MAKTKEHYSSWVEQVEKQDLPETLKSDFTKIGHLLINHIYQKSLRRIDSEKLEDWVRSRYSANTDERIIQKEFIIANQVGKFVVSKESEFDIALSDIKKVVELDNKLSLEEKARNDKLRQLKSEIEELREEKRKKRNKTPKQPKPKKKEKSVDDQPVTTKKEQTELNKTVDQEYIYAEWMKHVEEKSTSKSYWYIHEYIARFILKWGRENGDGTITKEVVDDFLTDYGKGKADKTMNHYNRVSRYFLEFCENIYKEGRK